MENSTLISVIIPSKNRKELLKEAIGSVNDQSHRPIEIIVVDDHSTDNTEQMIMELQEGLNEGISLRFETNPKNGAPSARNHGFNISKGSFIQFLDSDDLLLPHKLEHQVSVLLKEQSLDMVYSKARFINSKGEMLNEYWGKPLQKNHKDFFEFSWQTMCPLYRKKAIEKFGLWDEDLVINQDWEFSIRYVARGCKLMFLDEVNCLFRQHEQGNIGDPAITKSKAFGKFLSSKKLYSLLKEKGLITIPLQKLFLKRWIYSICLSSSLGDKKGYQEQYEFIKRNIPTQFKPLFFFAKWRWISRWVLKFHTYINS